MGEGEWGMAKHLLAICAAAVMLGAPILALAQANPASAPIRNPPPVCPGPISPWLAALLARFPAGGPALRAEIARLLEANPHLAREVAAAACSASPDQKEAIGAGMADAANYFAKLGSEAARLAETEIRTAMQIADPLTRYWFQVASTSNFNDAIPGFGNAGVATNRCVKISKSRPDDRDCD
jgi:hypothetical protein